MADGAALPRARRGFVAARPRRWVVRCEGWAALSLRAGGKRTLVRSARFAGQTWPAVLPAVGQKCKAKRPWPRGRKPPTRAKSTQT